MRTFLFILLIAVLIVGGVGALLPIPLLPAQAAAAAHVVVAALVTMLAGILLQRSVLVALLVLVATLLVEVAQIAIPHRSASSADIAANLVGIYLGFLVAGAVYLLGER